MNFQQFEYIIAIDTHRHFAKAAEKTNVTQPTLSMMVQKLEEELGIRIFDRSKQPVVPTPEGQEVIARGAPDNGRCKQAERIFPSIKA